MGEFDQPAFELSFIGIHPPERPGSFCHRVGNPVQVICPDTLTPEGSDGLPLGNGIQAQVRAIGGSGFSGKEVEGLGSHREGHDFAQASCSRVRAPENRNPVLGLIRQGANPTDGWEPEFFIPVKLRAPLPEPVERR